MKIETKFKFNDEVYFVEKDTCNNWIVVGSMFVDAIEIFVFKTDVNISYICHETVLKEQDCFSTKEEAQAECDKRNKRGMDGKWIIIKNRNQN